MNRSKLAKVKLSTRCDRPRSRVVAITSGELVTNVTGGRRTLEYYVS